MTSRAAILLAAVVIGCLVTAHLLAGSRWPARSPRLAIALWQALGLACGAAAIGALVGFAVAPYREGIAGGAATVIGDGIVPAELGTTRLVALVAGTALLAFLLGALATAAVRVLRARRRHRRLLTLVAGRSERTPDALVIDHPATTAYCLPGVRSTIVVSAGTINTLSRAELDAVLAHERAHARHRHDLVLLPFISLRLAFPFAELGRRASAAVDLLVEMAADDKARRTTPARELAAALIRVGTQRPRLPAGALGITPANAPVSARVARLLDPRPLPRWQQAVVAAAGAVLLTGTAALVLI